MNMRNITIAAISAIAIAMAVTLGSLYPGPVEASKDNPIVVANLAENPATAQPPYCKWTDAAKKSFSTSPSCKGQGPTKLSGTPCPVGSNTVCSGVTPTCCWSTKSSIFYCAARCS